MGLVSWFKQKFNVGGLKIKIVEVEPITEEEGWAKGKVAFSTQTPVAAELVYKLVCETTKGKGEEKKTDTSTVSTMSVLVGVAMAEPGSETQDFAFKYDLRNWFEQKGGVLGAASKMAKFAQNTFGEKGTEDFYVEIEARIHGVWLNPKDRRPVNVAVAR